MNGSKDRDCLGILTWKEVPWTMCPQGFEGNFSGSFTAVLVQQNSGKIRHSYVTSVSMLLISEIPSLVYWALSRWIGVWGQVHLCPSNLGLDLSVVQNNPVSYQLCLCQPHKSSQKCKPDLIRREADDQIDKLNCQPWIVVEALDSGCHKITDHMLVVTFFQ